MAGRKTRTKIRFQADKALADLDRCVEHLAKMEIIADERSPYINENLPKVIMVLEGARQILQQFKEGL